MEEAILLGRGTKKVNKGVSIIYVITRRMSWAFLNKAVPLSWIDVSYPLVRLIQQEINSKPVNQIPSISIYVSHAGSSVRLI